MHRKGIHCSSTAMGDALRARGFQDLPEEHLFGLGSGLGFSLHDGDTTLEPPQASRFFIGRSPTFERDLCERIGADLEQDYFSSTADAMRRLRELDKPLIYTDLRELPYLDAHGHWFGHLVVVERFDGDAAIVWDNEREEPQRVANLEKALCTETPTRLAPGALVLHIERAPSKAPEDAARKAILLQALQMTSEAAVGQGVEGIEQLAREIDSWRDAADWPRRARLAVQVIELRGCGGGFFRRMYARFLESALPELAQPCFDAADAWTELARRLDMPAASLCAKREAALWKRALEICQ
jgi:hypothetical protein